ncbi:MAG: Gfo/Idh/MocA family oxidoreductase [Planctomycetes bacterium]|nr:Gfo/Idh/MocA family oxidoreductase [Planctomycetota bacterium]MBL7042661.1 Gfo/Idh/MocA family oxidoreductase [Pirellulaceae bacterium]
MNKPNRTSRRRFLASSTATTTALATGLGLSRSVHAAGTERFNVALVGAGFRGAGAVADCLRVATHIKLVAMADAFENRANTSRDALQQRFPGQVDVPDERLFVGLNAYKEAIACDVDMIVQATPPGFRPLHYRAAIKAGKHVFMEKPCCVDAGGFRSMMDTNKLADQKKLKVGVGLFRRHMPAYLETMPKLHEGQLGKIQFMRCYCNMVAWGAQPRRPGESEMAYQVRNWRVFDWLGGGRLVEAHCHELDVMDWAMQDHPVQCNGMGGRTTLSSEPRFGEDYDHHFHEYTYADGTKMYSQCRQMNGCWAPITEHIHTDKTVIDLVGKIRITQARDRNVERVNPYRQEHADLLDAIWNDKPYNEGWLGATSSFTSILGREAGYSGQVVKWDELAANGPDLFPNQEPTWESQPPVLPDENGRYDHAVALPGIYRPY